MQQGGALCYTPCAIIVKRWVQPFPQTEAFSDHPDAKATKALKHCQRR